MALRRWVIVFPADSASWLHRFSAGVADCFPFPGSVLGLSLARSLLWDYFLSRFPGTRCLASNPLWLLCPLSVGQAVVRGCPTLLSLVGRNRRCDRGSLGHRAVTRNRSVAAPGTSRWLWRCPVLRVVSEPDRRAFVWRSAAIESVCRSRFSKVLQFLTEPFWSCSLV